MKVVKGHRQLSQYGDSKYLRIKVLASEVKKRDIIRVGGKRKVEVTIGPCSNCGLLTANRGKICRACLDRGITLTTKEPS
jgi:hypothetical protein